METTKKQYIMVLYQEHYEYKYRNNIRQKVYCYDSLYDTPVYKVFDDIDKAKEFIDNYNYTYELNRFDLYIDIAELYEIDTINNDIDFDNELYNNGLSYKDVAKENDIEIKF